MMGTHTNWEDRAMIAEDRIRIIREIVDHKWKFFIFARKLKLALATGDNG